MDRRRFAVLAAAACVNTPGSVAAQTCDADTCLYGGTPRSLLEMMTTGFVDLPARDASDSELALGLYRLSAIGRAGREALSRLEPAASMVETHDQLLSAMTVIAAAETDLQAAITRSDAAALSRAMTAAEHAWDLLTAALNAGGTLPETGTVHDVPETAAAPGAR